MSRKIFENVFVCDTKNKVTLTLNKPINIGISILESSKVLMYEFHYDYIKKNKYGNPAYNLYCRKQLLNCNEL